MLNVRNADNKLKQTKPKIGFERLGFSQRKTFGLK